MNCPCCPLNHSTLLDRLSNRVGSSLVILSLSSLTAFAQEGSEDIREVKDLIVVPEPPNYAMWGVCIFLGIIVAVAIYLLCKRKTPKREVSPAEKALSALDQSVALIPNESAEPFADAVAQIIRVYIEERFGISAPRRTTEEFLRQLEPKSNPEIAAYSGELGQFLRFCDATKFGGRQIESESRTKLLNSAKSFVEVTANPTAVEGTAVSPNTKLSPLNYS